jgi:hypothetical protein
MRIEIDVFSGRSNPGWIPEKGEAETINALLQELPPAYSREPVLGLGYRGFIIYRETNTKTEVVHVCSGSIWMEEDQTTVLEDKNHLEQQLLQWAGNKGLEHFLNPA